MKRSLAWPATLAVALVTLTGCGSSVAKPSATGTGSSVTSPSAKSSDGQAMAGMVMPGTTGDGDDGANQPTDTQALVCGTEIKDTVQKVLQLAAAPTTQHDFAGGLYTCDYDLPMGTMRLSVQHSATAKAARGYLLARGRRMHATAALAGLGEQAQGSGDGIVFVLKDNEVLEVDTTALPKVFGTEQQKRSDLAYEIASDVLGCWTGDDS